MKKFLPVLLMLTISTGAFAQWQFSMYADFFPEMMRFTSPLGDFANINKDDLYRGAGTKDFLSSSSEGVIGLQNELRIDLNYTGRSFGVYLQLAADEHIRPKGGFMFDDTMTASYNTLLNQTFREWHVWGKADRFTVYAGRTDDYGKTNRFEDAFDVFIYALKIDSYGIITPAVNFSSYSILGTEYTRADLSFNIIENNNFLPKLNIADEFGFVRQAYFSASAFFEPFTIQIAGDLGNASDVNPDRDGQAYRKMNGAVRFSGERVADFITFDAIYKLRGGDPNTVDNPSAEIPAPQPDGRGVTAHSFGLYANIFGLPYLEVGVGYTGLFRKYEDRDRAYTSDEDERRLMNSPFFSGIDLRLQFAGMNQLTVTSSNNISFARASGNTDPRIHAMSVTGTRTLLAGESEQWLALYNALSFIYQFSGRLTASLQAVNRFGIYTAESGGKKDTVTTNTLGITTFAAYRFNESIFVQAGVQFFMDNYNYQTAAGNDINGSQVYVAVPLRFKINF